MERSRPIDEVLAGLGPRLKRIWTQRDVTLA
jgi:hypothetical protein